MMQNKILKKNKPGYKTPAQAGTLQAAAIPDHRRQTAVQRQQVTGMNNKNPVLFPVQMKAGGALPDKPLSAGNAPIQLARWKYQKGRWVYLDGNNANSNLPYPKHAKEGDIFDDQTGMLTPANSSGNIKPVNTGSVSTGSQVTNNTNTTSNVLPLREVRRKRTQKMRGGPDERYNSDQEMDSRFAVSVNTSAKTCEVIIRIQSAASSGVFSKWASVTDAKWSNRFGLRVLKPDSNLSGFYMITVKLVKVQGHENPHHIVVPQDSNATFSDIRGMKGTRSMTEWGTEDAVDVPHEVGHMLGNFDEYFTINDVQYTAPGENARGGVDVGGGSIMNDPKNNPLKRHYRLIRKEAAAALGVDRNEITLEEATSLVQNSNSPKQVTKTSTPGGLDFSEMSAKRNTLKSVSSQPGKTIITDKQPNTNFKSTLRSSPGTISPGKLQEKNTGSGEEKLFDFGVKLRKTPGKETSNPPKEEKQIIPEQPISRPLLNPVKKTVKTNEQPAPKQEETVPGEKIKLSPPSKTISQPPREQKQEEVKQEEAEQELTPVEKKHSLLVNGFTRLREIIKGKPETKQRNSLSEEIQALGKTLTTEVNQLGDDFYLTGHWDTVVTRMFDLKRRIESL